MNRNLFTKEEIILCTFIARFGKSDFDENDISQLKYRSVSSIRMKVQNIVAMLDEEGFETNPKIFKLSGKTTGEKGRRTNWDIVRTLMDLSEKEFLCRCNRIISRNP